MPHNKKYDHKEFPITAFTNVDHLFESLSKLGYELFPKSFLYGVPDHIHTWADGRITHSDTSHTVLGGHAIEQLDTDEFINEILYKNFDIVDYANLQFHVTSENQLDDLLDVLKGLGHTTFAPDVYYGYVDDHGEVYIQTWDDCRLTCQRDQYDSCYWRDADTATFIRVHKKAVKQPPVTISDKFDYDVAVKGERALQTRSGLPVRVLEWNLNGYQMVGVVTLSNGEETLNSWDKNGTSTAVSSYDLEFVSNRVFPVTSLSEETLKKYPNCVAIANAAIKQYILDTEAAQ